MSNYDLDFDSINGFLKNHYDDEELRTYFLNEFTVCKAKEQKRDKLYWTDKYTGYRVDFLFANKNDERKFWIDNIINYSYLYVYAVLAKWREKYDDDLILKERCENYLRLYTSLLDDNIRFFVKNCHTIPTSIIAEIGFIIDRYLWLYHKEAPFFVDFVKKNLPKARILYENYCRLFVDSLKTFDDCYINYNIKHLLDYCKLTDLVVGKLNCFISLVSQLSTIGSMDNNLSKMIKFVTHNKCNFLTYRKIISFYCVNCGNLLENSNLTVSFCHNIDEINFWVKNKVHYNYLFIYCVVKEWLYGNQQSEDLEYWYGLLVSSENVVRLENEINLFKKDILNNCQEIPPSITYNIGFVIDSYWWSKEMSKPVLIEQLKQLGSTNLTEETIYENYCTMFEQTTKQMGIVSVIRFLDNVLDYCTVVDLIFSNDRCFRTLLLMFPKSSINYDIPEMLINITGNKDDDFSFETLYSLFNCFYKKYLRYDKLTNKDDKEIGFIKRNLIRIRINDYINRYGKIQGSRNLEEMPPSFREYESLHNNNLHVWLDCVEPWNFFDYYWHTNLHDFHEIVEDFRRKVIGCLQSECDNVINQAKEGKYNKSWAVSHVEELSKRELQRLVLGVLKTIKIHLIQYKIDKIKQCVNLAARECDFYHVHNKVLIKESSTLTEEKAKIFVYVSNVEIYNVVYYFKTDWMSFVQKLQAIKPNTFINKYINGHSFWGDWNSCYFNDSDYLKCIEALSDYLLQLELILEESIICYLDGKFIGSLSDKGIMHKSIIENTEKDAIQKWLKEQDYFKGKIN